MPTLLAESSTLANWALPIVFWILGGSLGGFLALWVAWLRLPPQLTLETNDISKEFNAESRLKIKNTGQLSAEDIRPQCTEISMKQDGIEMTNCAFYEGPTCIKSLSKDEVTEIPIPVGFRFPAGVVFDEFSYKLELKYSARMLFFSRNSSKSWLIALRNRPDGYSWNLTII